MNINKRNRNINEISMLFSGFYNSKIISSYSLTINKWNKNKIKRKRKSKLEYLINLHKNIQTHFFFHHHLYNTLIPVKHSFYFISYKHPNIAIVFHYFTHFLHSYLYSFHHFYLHQIHFIFTTRFILT